MGCLICNSKLVVRDLKSSARIIRSCEIQIAAPAPKAQFNRTSKVLAVRWLTLPELRRSLL